MSPFPLAPRQTLVVGQDRLCPEHLREANGPERDLAALGPVQCDLPPVVWAIQVNLLIGDTLALDDVNRDRMHRRLKSRMAPVDIDVRIGDAVEDEVSRRDATARNF